MKLPHEKIIIIIKKKKKIIIIIIIKIRTKRGRGGGYTRD